MLYGYSSYLIKASMLRYLTRSIAIGLITALLLIAIVPSLRDPLLDKFASQLTPPSSFTEMRVSFKHAVNKAAPAVVNIYSRQYSPQDRSQLKTQGLGSGVIVDKRGYIITNYHVIAQADQIIVALQDGRISNAQVVGSDRRTDIAILQIEMTDLPVIPQNPNNGSQVGDVVLAIGNPYNLGQTTTFGIISATGRSSISADGRYSFLQTDAAINEGNSGGALVNTQGELVGINTASFQQATEMDTYGISFAIPYGLAKVVMEKIIADGRVIRGYIGIDAQDINAVTARLLGVNYTHGIMVLSVNEGGPAEQAGLQEQDIILSIDGKKVEGRESVMEIVTDLRPATTAKFELLRDGEAMTIEVTVGEDKQ
jgi:serine protease DegS